MPGLQVARARSFDAHLPRGVVDAAAQTQVAGAWVGEVDRALALWVKRNRFPSKALAISSSIVQPVAPGFQARAARAAVLAAVLAAALAAVLAAARKAAARPVAAARMDVTKGRLGV